MLSSMADQPPYSKPSDYVLLPSVTHPGGRDKAFTDAFKAMVRFMVESIDNPTIAYAIDKTDRMVTEENRDLLSAEDLTEWDEACEQFESMPEEEQLRWAEQVLADYPTMDGLPDLDSYNDIN